MGYFKYWKIFSVLFVFLSISSCYWLVASKQKNDIDINSIIPGSIDAGVVFAGKTKTLNVNAFNPTPKEIHFRGANWACGKKGCLSLASETNDFIIFPGETINLKASIFASSVGDFDVTIEAYFEIDGVLKIIPVRAFGKVVINGD